MPDDTGDDGDAAFERFRRFLEEHHPGVVRLLDHHLPPKDQHPRYEQCRNEQMVIASSAATPVVRRARLLAAELQYYADVFEEGGAGGQDLKRRLSEQVDDSWAAFHSTPRTSSQQRPTAEFENLVRLSLVSAVETGAEWFETAQKLSHELGRSKVEALAIAIGRAAEVPAWSYPEFAGRMDREVLGRAIVVWARGAGPPAKDDPKGSRWEHLAQLCRSAGLTAVDAKAIRSAWEKRRRP